MSRSLRSGGFAKISTFNRDSRRKLFTLFSMQIFDTVCLYSLPSVLIRCLPASLPFVGCRQYRFTLGGYGSQIDIGVTSVASSLPP